MSISGYLLELGGAAGKVRSRPVLLCPQLKPEHTALSSAAQEAVWTTDARSSYAEDQPHDKTISQRYFVVHPSLRMREGCCVTCVSLWSVCPSVYQTSALAFVTIRLYSEPFFAHFRDI